MNSATTTRILKQDLLGCIEIIEVGTQQRIRRDTSRAHPALRLLARRLLRRERSALLHLARAEFAERIPRLIFFDERSLERHWLPGSPMQQARPCDPRYFRDALRLLRALHTCGVTHNDLAKEPNWLITPSGQAALVDFQLAYCSRRRGRLFRALAYIDLRHLYKHKRTYCPQALTARQRRLLEQPSLLSKLWRMLVKCPYLFVTRRVLGWADREGRYERH